MDARVRRSPTESGDGWTSEVCQGKEKSSRFRRKGGKTPLLCCCSQPVSEGGEFFPSADRTDSKLPRWGSIVKLKGHLNVLISRADQRSLAADAFPEHQRGGLMFRRESARSHGKLALLSLTPLAARPGHVLHGEAGGSLSLAVSADTRRSLAEERIIKGATGDKRFFKKKKPLRPEPPQHQGNVGDEGG